MDWNWNESALYNSNNPDCNTASLARTADLSMAYEHESYPNQLHL